MNLGAEVIEMCVLPWLWAKRKEATLAVAFLSDELISNRCDSSWLFGYRYLALQLINQRASGCYG